MKAAKDTIDELESLSWSDVMPRLEAHALRRMRGRAWNGILARGGPVNVAEDVVQAALERVISGRRQRNVARYPDLVDYLQNVIDSIISQMARSWSQRREHPQAALDAASARAFDGAVDPDADAALRVLEEQEEAGARFLSLRFHDALADDPFLQALFDLLDNKEQVKRAHLARALNVTPSAIDNARRRLQRRFVAFMAQDRAPCM